MYLLIYCYSLQGLSHIEKAINGIHCIDGLKNKKNIHIMSVNTEKSIWQNPTPIY